ncbi:hypothetical protein P9A30_gp20 [Sphingomonas phage Lucius]|uniref:Tail fiber protein n=1 Tax=Sphingomonas phage Lucius TaxID=2686313 RepID=A0A6M3TC35_9CAUD|nr:hypothetical protein P9A30_gp20 [Sphingomonas phage Lucius]QJD54462.1 hypothetical protein [Sphingomonas phage Lucius]
MAQKRITDLDAGLALTGDELIEVSQLSDTVTITATTLSALASDNSLNDSANGFVTAGFEVGDRVNVVGFTGNVANNLFVGIVTALTAGKMTIGGTDGDVIVDDAAGESVTISKWTSRRTTAQDIANLGGAVFAGIYRVGFFFVDTPASNEPLMFHCFTDAVDFDDDFAGSVASVENNPALSFVVSVEKNGVAVGSITVSTGGVVTFVTTGAGVSFAIGDVMSITAPATADATIARCSFTFKGQM